MRLLISAAWTADGAITDLAVECAEDATIADLARQLAKQGPAEAVVVRGEGRRLGVVVEQSPLEAARPTLWLREHELDPAQRVVDSPLRHGVVVGVDTKLPDLLAEPNGVVDVRVASGPGAGAVHRLGPGRYEVGADGRCAVVLADASIPPVALWLDVDVGGTVAITPHDDVAGQKVPAPSRQKPLDGPIVVAGRDDLEPPPLPKKRRWWRRRKRSVGDVLSSDGTPRVTVDPDADRSFIELDRLGIDEQQKWEPGMALTVGPSMLDLSVTAAPDASVTLSPDGATVDFNRPPRLRGPDHQTEFTLPKEPQRPDRMPMPFLMIIAPIIMGATLFIITQRLYTLVFIALSPMMMIANFSQGRTTQKRRYERAMQEFEDKTQRIEHDALTAIVTERAARRYDLPDPGQVLLFATGPRARLWERRRTDTDWLTVRVGTADVPSDVVLKDPTREQHQGPLTWTAPDVPVAVSLEKMGVTGIGCRGSLAGEVGRWMVAQAAALHSHAELRVVVLADKADEQRWSWVRWLPHARHDETGPLAAVGSDDETTARRLSELVRELQTRREAAANSQGVRFDPILVVLDGARSLRLLGGMVPLLRFGPDHGITFLCLDEDVTLLPEECRAVVSGDRHALRVEISGELAVDGVRPDLVTNSWFERLGRALSPIRDVSETDAVSTLPTSSRLLTVLKMDPPEPEKIAQIWARGGRTTAAVIGEGAEGFFELDIRRDGPHGLVAGTTGSGKSELLQTIIGSLAVGNRPDEMTFVLVDYKGGAAFKDCANLPHTVGMVTDLDGHLTQRALESLGAELRRREHQLARAGAKDIEDYLAGKEPMDDPMPRLVIVIDEFAALVAELPDFVNGLIDIARRGRSLGVHLILATQRPAGVVSAEIKSNTNLRIALRVTDPADSQDVIESDVAAHIAASTPGRAYARLGHSSLIPFQSSRVGGRRREEGGATEVGLHNLDWRSLGRQPMARPVSAEEDEDVSVPTDLASLVTAIGQASKAMEVRPPPSPWLPPLPELIVLDDLLNRGELTGSDVPRLPLGLADLPSKQSQEVMTWDFASGQHLAVAGQPRSGRSSVLRLIAAGLARLTSPTDVHVFAIDCGNNALLPLVSMPQVGAVVGRDQPDRLRRLLALLGREISRRQQLLAMNGHADIAEQRTAAESDDRLPYLVLLLDRWEGYLAQFESTDGGTLVEQVMQLLREGSAVGLRAAFTGDKSLATARMGAVMEDRLLLRMPAAEDYAVIGMRARDVPTHMPTGRAFRGGEVPREVQMALLSDDVTGTAQVAALQKYAAQGAERVGPIPASLRPPRVDELPLVITFAEAAALEERRLTESELVVGAGGDTLGLRTLDVLSDGQGFLVVGPPRSGRSTALLNTVEFALRQHWKVALVCPRRSPLRDLARRRGVIGVFDDATDAATLRQAMEVRGPRLMVIDDYEVLGAEHALASIAEQYLASIRDSVDGLVVACGIDEATSMYRGVTATLRKARTGLILAPRASTDGDVLSARLPRSAGGVVPAGRGILVKTSGWEWVQIPMAES